MIGRLLELQRDGGRAVVLTVVEGQGLGSKLLVVEGGDTERVLEPSLVTDPVDGSEVEQRVGGPGHQRRLPVGAAHVGGADRARLGVGEQ